MECVSGLPWLPEPCEEFSCPRSMACVWVYMWWGQLHTSFFIYILWQRSQKERGHKVPRKWHGKVTLPHIWILPWIKKGPFVYISQLLPPSSPGKSIGHCGVACVIINNNLPLTQTLGNLCSRICDLRTIEVWLYLLPLPSNLTLDPELGRRRWHPTRSTLA